MPEINPDLPSNGDDAVVDVYNAAIEDILAVLNGAIDEDNLATGAVILSKLASAVQNALVPTGTILAYGGSAAPSGYLLCYGQSVLRSTYADLFAIIGTVFGSADGTHFTMPDLRGRVPVGADAMGGTAANVVQRSTTITTTNGSPSATVASATGLLVGQYIVSANVPAGTTILSFSGTTITMSANASASASGVAARFSQFANDAQVLGALGGASSHVLITAQLASHSHSGNINADTGSSGFLGPNTVGSWTRLGTISNSGSDQAHPNMQPSQITSYMIKT